jgi:hypothetical protein
MLTYREPASAADVLTEAVPRRFQTEGSELHLARAALLGVPPSQVSELLELFRTYRGGRPNSIIIGGPLGWSWQATLDTTHHGALAGPTNAHRHSDLANVGIDDHHARDHATRHAVGGGDQVSLDASQIGSGTLGVTRGGTGLSTIAAGGILYASAADTLSRIAPTAANQVLRSTAANALEIAALVAADIPSLDASKITSGRFGMERMPDGTSGYVLTAQGAGANPAYAAVSADFFNRFREFIPWVSVDGFTVAIDTGCVVAARFPTLYLYTAASLRRARLRSSEAWHLLLDSGKEITVEWIINYISATGAVDGYSLLTWLRLDNGTTDPPEDTTAHFGWKIDGSHIICSNGNGTNQTATDLYPSPQLTPGFQRTRLKAVLTPGTDCKFYLNDVLKATHTTNLPTQASYYLIIHFYSGAAGIQSINLGRVLVEKVHA